MTTFIHPTAIVDKNAVIGQNCSIGPYCVIGAKVVLGDHCTLHSHIVIDGDTHIGNHAKIYPFASIGTNPQDLKYKGEPTQLRIGNNNTIREQVTINPGTAGDKSLTQIGDNNLLMIGVHIAHDCIIGNHNVLANNATLAGHVKLGDNVVVGGLSAVHQFVRIGDHAMIGGMSGVENYVIPYGMVMGERARLAGLNIVGLERRGFAKADMQILMKVFKHIFMSKDGTFKERLHSANENYKDNAVVAALLDFAMAENSRPLCQPK